MTPEQIQAIFVWYGCLLFSLVIHEASHALLAKIGGDLTAYQGGQVTLNPLPHMRREPFGTVILPLAMLISTKGGGTMGYAHIPVDPVWAARHPRRAALMSAAGPLSNLLLAILAFAVAKFLIWNGSAIVAHDSWPVVLPPYGARDGIFEIVCQVLSVLLCLNLLLATLNLLPFPPLDGGGIVQGLFPDSLGRVIRLIQSQPIVVIGIMVLVFFNFMTLITPVFRLVRSWL